LDKADTFGWFTCRQRAVPEAIRAQRVIRGFRVAKTTGSTGLLVGAVGTELKATLKARKLLISLNAKNS